MQLKDVVWRLGDVHARHPCLSMVQQFYSGFVCFWDVWADIICGLDVTGYLLWQNMPKLRMQVLLIAVWYRNDSRRVPGMVYKVMMAC